MPDDTVWINLKIVAALPSGYRLNTQRELFYHQAPHWWTSVCRTLQGAHRTACVRRLDALVERTCALAREADANGGNGANGANGGSDANGSADGDSVGARLRTHLRAAGDGIRRLQQSTYDDDATVRAALDRVLDKIGTAVGRREMSNTK